MPHNRIRILSDLEAALRSALNKGNIGDPIYRRKVYEKAASALTKSLESKGIATQERLEAQKRRLAEAIKAIEADVRAATPPVVKPAAAPAIESRASEPVPPVEKPAETLVKDFRAKQADPQVEPEAAPINGHLYVEPKMDRSVEPPQAPAGEPTPKSKPFAKFLVGAVAVCLLAVGLLWIINTGAFQSADERDTSVPNPELVLESENSENNDPGTADAPQTLADRGADSDGWMTLFDPSDVSALNLVDGATASVEQDSSGAYALIATPNEVAEVRLTLPRNILQQAAGSPLQVSLRVRSEEGARTQMAITCRFPGSDGCPRMRFDVGQAESEFLYQVNIAQDASIERRGILKIVTDVQENTKAIKLIQVRVRTAE